MDKKSATEMIKAAEEVLKRISILLEIVNSSLLNEQRRRVQLALGTVIAELDLEVLEPIYQEFPDLRPPEMVELRQ